jgi:hypothetical protein
MAVRRQPHATPKPVTDGAEALLHWERFKPVPAEYLNHQDPEVAALAGLTADVARLFRRAAHGKESYDRDDALAYLRTAYGRLNAARRVFAQRRGLEWTAILPGGQLVRRTQD